MGWRDHEFEWRRGLPLRSREVERVSRTTATCLNLLTYPYADSADRAAVLDAFMSLRQATTIRRILMSPGGDHSRSETHSLNLRSKSMLKRERMRRTDTGTSARSRHVGVYVLCGLALAAVAGCGGGGDTSAAAPQSVTQTGSTSGTASSQGAVANLPATVGGTPGTQVQSGQLYSFTPSASDPDGDTLTFSVRNKPSWAIFSASSGQLSGTPSSAQVGTYPNIVISVSDGTSSESLAPFSVTVTAPPASTGSALLSWHAPTSNSDGSALANLAGYRIDYGASSDALTHTVTISDPTATSYTLQGLAAGTWYFAVADFTSAGTVSALSSVVTKTIQ